MRFFRGLLSSFGVGPIGLVVAALSTRIVLGQAFTDGFEGAALDPFWTPFVSSTGVVTMPSTTQVHEGSQSLKLDTFNVAGVNKGAGIRHLFSPPTWGKVEVWLYDSGADVRSSNYFSLHTGPYTIGTWDYDLGPGANGSFYVYAATGPNGTALNGTTSIDRTLGWHHFVIRTSPTASSLAIDGTIVYSALRGTPLPDVQLEMHAPDWRPPMTTCFDDFAYDPCNGMNQPFMLIQTPAFMYGQNFGGGLIVDVDLADCSTVFSGLAPGGFFFATNSAGWAAQVVSLPSALAGTVARVQGVVLDRANICAGGLGFMATATFELHF